MEKSDFDRIQHIQRYCVEIKDTIVRFGNSLEIFMNDKDFFKSLSMSLMQIGELAGSLSNSFKDSTRERLPWGLMKGMRNRFVHGYGLMDKSQSPLP
jgi:uncharacterized protein with HEPN domain